jgi:PAS domain S-box-containing protein
MKNSPVKILMVDDLPENLYSLKVILKNQNYECIKAGSGEEALKILETDQDFAIILMDVQMPGMNGFEVVEKIRKDEKLKLLPIIFLTANMDSENIYRGYEAGAVDYMIKPLSAEILRAKVGVFADLYRKTQQILAQKEHVKSLNSDVEIQKSLSKYSNSLIEASLDPLFTVSLSGKLMDMNEATVRITGVEREKLIGSDFFNYFTDTDRAREVYLEVFAKGSVVNSPLTLRHINGELTDVYFNGSVYKDDNGKVSGIVIVARDVTEQKRAATELFNAKVAAEQATGIAEEAKIKAESATFIAENAVKAKQQFLSNMSHEIRTPMNAIIGFTKVMLKTDLSERQTEYLSAIKISGEALIVLINDILDLAKVDSGKMTFERIPFKMSVSISAMLQLFETKILEKNIELVKEYDPSIPEVLLGDPVRLHQVILNLISNAVKFTSDGKITVRVKMLRENKEKATIEFSVTDTGIGIAEDKIEHIFENFQQASGDTLRLYGGTGLGLAIVKQLIEPQGGTISVKSKIGVGSTFSFQLTFLKTSEQAIIETGEVEIDRELKNIKILVVEDIQLNQLLMKTLLDDFGFELDIAANGKIAIEKLKIKKYDLVLMDLQMPVMNGFEATNYIRTKLKSNVPIIALTADVTTVDLEKCKSVGMNDYISKPIDDKLLYSKIVHFVKKPNLSKQMKSETKSTKQKYSIINLDYLFHLTKSNPALISEMLHLYLEQTPELIQLMKESFKDKDLHTLHQTMHKMIPSFSIVGINPEYENMAKKVQEYAVLKTEGEEIPNMILNLEDILDKACQELNAELDAMTIVVS